ncbi:MAG: hypothetical protein ACK40D_01185, partial [Cyanobacteriota bacterium]
LRYRQRIAQLMLRTAERQAPPPSAPRAMGEAMTFTLPAEEPAVASVNPNQRDTPLRIAARLQRRAAVVQITAGLAFGLAAALWQCLGFGFQPTPIRLLVMGWSWSWPTVLALGLVWEGDRRRTLLAWAAYLAGGVLICLLVALGPTPPLTMRGIQIPAFFQGPVMWATDLAFAPLLLLFLNRAIRSVAPAMFVILLMAMLGAQAAFVIASTPLGLWALSWLAFLHLPMIGLLAVPQLIGMLAALPIAWWLLGRLRAAYSAKWISDQSLILDTLWAFQSGLFAFQLTQDLGAAGWWGGALFLVYKAIALAGMAPAAWAARRHKPWRLLLLRVVTRRDRWGRQHSRRFASERLFDVLACRWRAIGPITMIGAPDLASSTITPEEFLDFLVGKLRERFILDQAEVPPRLAALDDRPDPDARWRVSEFFCGKDTWHQAVEGLMGRCDLVAMDLRDFGPDNLGCLLELQSLVDIVPLERCALLIDDSTRRDVLEATLKNCLARTYPTAPNGRDQIMPIVINVTQGEREAVDQLLCLAPNPPAGRTGPPDLPTAAPTD